VCHEADRLDPEVLDGVPFWVEVRYSDSMDAKISINGRAEVTRDISIERLLRVADEAAARASGA
jgi:hypothetical protein